MGRSNANSFQNRVPTGNSHASGRLASIEVPGGSAIQRRFVAESAHSGYCGENGNTPGCTVVTEPAT